MIILILIVLGVCFGSFVNAFVWRFHEQAELREQYNGKPKQLKKKLAELSISRGRSMCVHCRHELAAKDLIPVVSYIWLRGRCRYCKKSIQDTPLSELVTPVLFVVSYLVWPYPFSGVGLFLFSSWLVFLVGFVALALYDARWYELPHRIVLPLIGFAVLQTIIVLLGYEGGIPTVLRAAYGAVIGGGVFYVLYVISPKQKLEDGSEISRWIGGGDITLGFLLGLLVGGPANALLLIFVASLLGTLVALPLMLVGKASRTTQLPFGPYLLLAAVIVILWGGRLIAWYTSLLGF